MVTNAVEGVRRGRLCSPSMRSIRLVALSLLMLAGCGDDDPRRSEPDSGPNEIADAAVDAGPQQCTGADCTELFVTVGGTGTACTQAAPCGKIQAALALRAKDPKRSVIRVAPGKYVESIYLVNLGSGSVTLFGEGVDLSADATKSVVNIDGEVDVTLIGF